MAKLAINVKVTMTVIVDTEDNWPDGTTNAAELVGAAIDDACENGSMPPVLGSSVEAVGDVTAEYEDEIAEMFGEEEVTRG